MLVRASFHRNHRGPRHQALGHTLELEEAAILTVVERRYQVWNFIGQSFWAWVNFQADFVDTETLAMFRVLRHVAPNARQQARANQFLIARNGIQHADVLRGVEAESAHRFLA